MPRIYKPDHQGLQAVLEGPEIAAALDAIAGKGKAYAESISPVSDDDGEHYRDQFEIHRARFKPRRGPARQSRDLVNTSDHAVFVEVGNEHTDGHRVLGRTLDKLEHL